jgi:hypothetical protein
MEGPSGKKDGCFNMTENTTSSRCRCSGTPSISYILVQDRRQ